MSSSDDDQSRLAILNQITTDPPKVHAEATDGNVWSAFLDCYQFMAEWVHPGARTLETGAGLSTVLFAAWGCQHLCIVPYPREAEAIRDYCDQHGIDTATGI